MHLTLNNAKEEDKYKDKGIKDEFSILYFTSNIMCYVKHTCVNRITLVSQGRLYMFSTERVQITGAPNDNFQKNICSEDDLRSGIFGTFVVKFLACLPLLGFSNI